MADPSLLTKIPAQEPSTSPGLQETLSGGSILDSLKLLLAGAGLSDVLATIARLIEAQRPGMLCSIFLLESDGMRLRYAAAPNLPEAYRAATDGMVIGPNIGSCGRAAFLREPVFASDILSDPNWAKFRDAAASAGLRAAWSSPIMSHDSEVLGTFGMYYQEVRYPEPSDIQLIQHASSIAGIAIERERSRIELTRAFEEVKKSERQLQQTVDAIPQTIVVLGSDGSVEYANRTVIDYTGLSAEDLKVTRNAATRLPPRCTLYTLKVNSNPLRRNAMANSKDVVVTGVSTGIGWGTTKVLVSKGFRVFGSVRKQADADRLQREFGNGFVPLIMDITDAEAVHQAAQNVGSMIGDRNLVGLVNNAGIVVSGPLLYLKPSEYRRQLEVNMVSPLVVIQAFAPLLGTDKKRQGLPGRIVNITSSAAKVAIPLLGAYSASKFGLEGMSDALRRELMLFGIDVVIIEPGTVNTAMYDKGEKEDLSEFKQTEYWEAVQNFQKFIVTEARTNGLSPERLGQAVHVAISTAKPKARYAVIPQRFKNWILPRLLPARMLDAELAKQMKLTKL